MNHDGWKYRKNGRFYRVEIIEEGDWTGMAIEQLRQSGKSVNEIVRSAMQLLVQQPGWKVKVNDMSGESSHEDDVESEVRFEPVNVTPGSIPTCFQPIAEEVEERLFNELLAEFKRGEPWQRIRNVMYCCNSITRTSAWNELTQDERQRVWLMMPETTRDLAKAKKKGIIRDYREQLCGNKYEIYTWNEEAPIIVNTYMVERTLESITKNN